MSADAYLHLRISGGLHAPARARIALKALDDDLPAPRRDDILLLVSELVGNSVRHSGVAPGDMVSLEVWARAGECVRVEASDPGLGFDEWTQQGDRERASGFGLVLVDHLASRWGAEARPGRFTVWFEIDL